jgi:hypothetical protein
VNLPPPITAGVVLPIVFLRNDERSPAEDGVNSDAPSRRALPRKSEDVPDDDLRWRTQQGGRGHKKSLVKRTAFHQRRGRNFYF